MIFLAQFIKNSKCPTSTLIHNFSFVLIFLPFTELFNSVRSEQCTFTDDFYRFLSRTMYRTYEFFLIYHTLESFIRINYGKRERPFRVYCVMCIPKGALNISDESRHQTEQYSNQLRFRSFLACGQRRSPDDNTKKISNFSLILTYYRR